MPWGISFDVGVSQPIVAIWWKFEKCQLWKLTPNKFQNGCDIEQSETIPSFAINAIFLLTLIGFIWPFGGMCILAGIRTNDKFIIITTPPELHLFIYHACVWERKSSKLCHTHVNFNLFSFPDATTLSPEHSQQWDNNPHGCFPRKSLFCPPPFVIQLIKFVGIIMQHVHIWYLPKERADWRW